MNIYTNPSVARERSLRPDGAGSVQGFGGALSAVFQRLERIGRGGVAHDRNREPVGRDTDRIEFDEIVFVRKIVCGDAPDAGVSHPTPDALGNRASPGLAIGPRMECGDDRSETLA